jgi:peptide/nickel transport system substrate-binding protein
MGSIVSQASNAPPVRHCPELTRRQTLTLFALAIGLGAPVVGRAANGGQLTWGLHISLAPTWFDPAETSGIVTPHMVMYALHDAMVKPMPGEPLAPSLAQSWSESEDGLTYEFVLRPGVKFHNGDSVTADDVRFSFERYRGASAAMMHGRIAAIESPDPRHVRFRLKQPWSDFLTFYGSATGAGWIVPKRYIEKVGDDGFKKAPIGAGPYRFVSFRPGIELVLEAVESYWRKPPTIKRLVLRAIPEGATRLAALTRGEVDIAYHLTGELAEAVERTRGLTLKATVVQTPFWLYFPEQWDAKSPWHDRRVRLAAGLAINRDAINQAVTGGHSLVTGSIIPDSFEYFWQPPAPMFDPSRAKQLLVEAGYPKGFEAGDYTCDASFTDIAEPVLNDLQTVGIRAKLRPLERAAFNKGYAEKAFKGIILGVSGAFGNAATRLEAFAVKGGAYAYGSDPELDALFQQQASERDRARRGAILEKMQQLIHERALFTPIWQLAAHAAVGPRVTESGLGLIRRYPFSAPYEDVVLKGE